MSNSFLIALWVGISFIIYKIVASIIVSRRHAAAARRLGCQPAYRIKDWTPGNISSVMKVMKADQEFRVPQYLTDRMNNISKDEGRQITTVEQNILGSRTHLTTEPRNVQAVLATQFKEFGLGERRNGNFAHLLGDGIFSTDGKEWENARTLLRPQFARDQVSDLELEELHIQNMMRAIPAAGKDGWTEVTNIQPLFFRLTLDSATEFLYGESVGSQLAAIPGYVSSKASNDIDAEAFANSFDKAQLIIGRATRLGDLSWTAFGKEFNHHRDICYKLIDYYVQRALSKKKSASEKHLTPSGKEKYVFLDALVESTRNPEELRSHLISILLAGRDTTASLLSYTYMLFTQHPAVYAKLRTIVLEEFGTYTSPKNLTFANLKSCNYLQWVLNETLRLYPVVPFDSRRALKDTTIPLGGGPDGSAPVYIREGDQVDYSVYVMHRRKDLWGPDAEQFKPERWNGRKSGWEYLPFNGGPRICIGQQFALTEAGYVIVRLAQRFEEMMGVGNTWEEEGVDGGMGYVRESLTLTSCPADGVKVRMKEAAE